MGGRFTVQCGWDEVPHLTPEDIAEQTRNIPPYQLEARSKGIPTLGAGAIYPVPEDFVLCTPFEIPDHYPQCYALDVGWNRTAAIWGAHDTETDVLYLYSEHYRGQAEPPVHAEAIRARGRWIPGVIDPAARGRAQRDGESLMNIYKELGLDLSPADNSLEAGLHETWIRLSTGRLKVFKTLQNWLSEYRFYQRDEKGRVKDGQNDHLMDAMRYLVMSGIKRAVVRPADQWRRRGEHARHTYDYDPLA